MGEATAERVDLSPDAAGGRAVPADPGRTPFPLIRARAAWRWWTDPGARAEATRWARGVRPEATAVSVRRLARRGLFESERSRETVRRAPTEAHLDVEGLEHLQGVLEAGRGAVLVTAHTGSLSALAASLLVRGCDVMLVVSSKFDDADADADGPRPRPRPSVDALRRFRTAFGDRVIVRGGAYAVALEHLRRGGACILALDGRGDVEATFAGRRTSLPGGPAALSLEADAPIVPAFAVRSRGSAGFLLPAIDPAGFAGHRELHESVASVVGDAVLEHVARTCPRSPWPARPGIERFSANLAGRRAQVGLSRRELARRTGVRARRLARMEEALVEPSLSELARLASALDTEPKELLRRVF